MRMQWTIAVLGLAVSAAALADPREGKWEYSTTMKMDGGPAMPKEAPKLPPGVQLPPGMQLPQFGPKGMTMKHTDCLTKEDLVPKTGEGMENCTITKMDRKGNVVNWAGTCDTEHGKAQAQGTATYTDTTMTSTMTSHINDKEMGKLKVTNETTGRYVGACDK